ncbi:MAG: aminoglycoside phosphotransferase family protein [Prevotellaceae bacterium]|jgi:Ser/Thr protein kinase RdoA (MazF antagonist)|nr:aminoglycoside phosphotransferase family protein [Prevotellaceae bacterium]
MNNLKKTVEQFVSAKDIQVELLGAGHINDSYKVSADGKNYVLQRINHLIFKNVPELQNNIMRVTAHIGGKLANKGVAELDRRVLSLVPAKDGQSFHLDEAGNYWRMTKFIANSRSYDNINPELARMAGVAFGEFQQMLSDLPAPPLYETIPDFHNMEYRLEQFWESVKLNRVGRFFEVSDLVGEIEQRVDEMCLPEKLYREGKLPKRTNHCDTKVNNLLFDANGTEVLCVVDLDTVMPGFVLSDFGDFMRTGANNGDEDDTNLDRVSINLAIFEAYTDGYLQTASKFLTDTEVENLALGAKMLTYMQTVRFLTDYINGDIYYKVKHPKHNLERSYAQFKLLQSMEENFIEMQQIVALAAEK